MLRHVREREETTGSGRNRNVRIVRDLFHEQEQVLDDLVAWLETVSG